MAAKKKKTKRTGAERVRDAELCVIAAAKDYIRYARGQIKRGLFSPSDGAEAALGNAVDWLATVRKYARPKDGGGR